MPIQSPSTELYTLGRGVATLGAWDGATPPLIGDMVDLGNAPACSFTMTEEILEHKNYRAGLRVKDKTVVIESGYTGKLELDEISAHNLALFVKGTMVGSVIRANTVLNAEYCLIFTCANPVGPNPVYTFHRLKLKPEGDFGLISDEWSKLSFSFEGLSDATNNPDSPFFDVDWPTTTTT